MQDLMETLEALIDKHGLTEVLATVTLITGEKADHIRHAWQDSETAKPWDKMSAAIDKAAHKAQSLGI